MQHLAVAQEPAGVGAVAFEQDRKVVAGPEFALQVELVAEDADQVMGEGLGHTAHEQGVEEAPLDPRLHQHQVLAMVARQRRVRPLGSGAGRRRRRQQRGLGPPGNGRRGGTPAALQGRRELFPFVELLPLLDAGHPILAGERRAHRSVGLGGRDELREGVAGPAHEEPRLQRLRRTPAWVFLRRRLRSRAQGREREPAKEQRRKRARSTRNGVWQVPMNPPVGDLGHIQDRKRLLSIA